MSEVDMNDVPATHDRRRFLRWCWIGGSAAAIATAVPIGWRRLEGAADDVDLDLATATPDTFAPHVGKEFEIDGGLRTATLANVTQLSPAAFSLQFALLRGVQIGQDTHTFRRRGLGTFPLFVVPGSVAEASTCSAIFNREVA